MATAINTGRTRDLLAGFDPNKLMPSSDIRGYFTEGREYTGMLEFTGIKLELSPLHKKSGNLTPIVTFIAEYTITVDKWAGLPDTVDPKVDGAIFMPIMPDMDPSTGQPIVLKTDDERGYFQDSLTRGEQQVGPFYAFAEMPLQPDPHAANRLAPLGRYGVRVGIDKYPDGSDMPAGLHPNWAALLDYRMREGAPLGFPVKIKPSAGGYLNPTCLDRNTYSARLLREEEARRAQQQAAEGFTDTQGTGYTEHSYGGQWSGESTSTDAVSVDVQPESQASEGAGSFPGVPAASLSGDQSGNIGDNDIPF